MESVSNGIVIREVNIHEPITILGHTFNGLDDIRRCVEAMVNFRISQWKWQLDKFKYEDYTKVDGIHVAIIVEDYPTFDESDRLYETRYYRNYFFSKEPFNTIEDCRFVPYLEQHKIDRVIHASKYECREWDERLLPFIFYRGEGDEMTIVEKSGGYDNKRTIVNKSGRNAVKSVSGAEFDDANKPKAQPEQLAASGNDDKRAIVEKSGGNAVESVSGAEFDDANKPKAQPEQLATSENDWWLWVYIAIVVLTPIYSGIVCAVNFSVMSVAALVLSCIAAILLFKLSGLKFFLMNILTIAALVMSTICLF